MQGTISKWGNSLALRLPKHVADQAQLAEGTTVEFEVVDGALKVIPARKKLKLADLLEGEPSRPKDAPSAEVDWGKPRGKEVW